GQLPLRGQHSALIPGPGQVQQLGLDRVVARHPTVVGDAGPYRLTGAVPAYIDQPRVETERYTRSHPTDAPVITRPCDTQPGQLQPDGCVRPSSAPDRR